MSATSFDPAVTSPVHSSTVAKTHGHRGSAKLSPARVLKQVERTRRSKFWGGLLVVTLVLVLVGTAFVKRGWKEFGETAFPLVFYSVTQCDLPITVTERGSLESQQNTEIRSEVETYSSQPGTRIVSIVPNGTSVKKGDLLVELDSAPLQERVDNYVVQYELTKASKIQADVKLENQKAQNETALDSAKLRVELADMSLRMYEDGQEGTYQITLQDLGLKIQEAKNQIAEAQAAMLLQETARAGMEMLYKLGYRGKGDLDQAVYRYIQAEDTLVKATNSLANAIASRKKLEEFEYPMKKLELNGALNTARRALTQAQDDNEAQLRHAEAAQKAAERALAKEEERLKRHQAMLAKCKIYAPHDGMVAYSTERTPFGRMIGEGELVVERMKILSLPDLSSMQVKTMVHESVLDQVRVDLPATITIDAFPDRTYRGTVRSVAVLPSQGNWWANSDVKVYETIVTIDEKVEQLKPGMTAVTEIHVDRLENIVAVPVQAVTQIEHENWCYVEGLEGIECRPVTLGRTNDKFIQIVDGLKAGERVVLNPMAIVNDSEDKGRMISPE